MTRRLSAVIRAGAVRAPGRLRKVDWVQLPVPDLDGGLAFYRDRLGHKLLWRTETAAGLGLADSDSELVLQTHGPSWCWRRVGEGA